MNRVNFTSEQIGPYDIRERIGQGGMADVYRAYQSSMKREVALKVIPLIASSENDQIRRRFELEAEMIARLEHPHILPVFDYGVSDDVLYLAMRLLRGGTLRELLNRNVLTLDRSATIFGQVALALGYAHRQGIIHRDLKPSNILIDDEGHAYLADFGLAKVLGGTSQLTTTGSIIGTPAYMSPEQLRGDPINHRSDVYSLGVILYHMIVGRPPFEALTTFSLIYQHIEKEPPLPREYNPDIPQQVEAVILRALQKNPAARFESAEQMANELDDALGRKVSSERQAFSEPPPLVEINQSTTPLTGGFQPSAAEPTPPLPTAGSTGQYASPGGQTRTSRLLLFGLPAVLVVLAVLTLVLLNLNTTPAIAPPTLTPTLALPTLTPTFAPPTILAEEIGYREDVQPTEGEIAIAQRRLGDDGFIAYIVCNQDSEFFAGQARRMSDMANQMGLGFELYDSETDPNRQIIQIERARTNGARALIVCVLEDVSLLEDVLTSAQEAGIPFVLQNIDAPPDFGGVVVTSDNYQMGLEPGRYMGQLVAEELGGEADVVILDFPSLPLIVRRADGLQDGLLEYAPEANIVGRYQGGIPELGEESIQALLDDGIEFDVILSINDAGAYGAIAALEDAGIGPDEVMISGIDAESLARQHIRESYYMRVSVDVVGDEIPQATIGALVKLLAGSTLPATILTPPAGLVTHESLMTAEE